MAVSGRQIGDFDFEDHEGEDDGEDTVGKRFDAAGGKAAL
jgi:hypothetical protein